MNLLEALNAIEDRWRENTKPAIQRGNIGLALNDMQNLNLAFNSYLEQFTSYHSGLSFVVYAKSIQDQLFKGEVNSRTMDEFEAYLRQTRMSISTGNLR